MSLAAIGIALGTDCWTRRAEALGASDTAPIPAQQQSLRAAVGPQLISNERAWYDVRRYGALGDGQADDTPAIRAAIAAAGAAGGGMVMIPPGTYRLATGTADPVANNGFNLWLPSNVNIVGAGRGRTVLRNDRAYSSILYTRGAANVTVRDVTLDGGTVIDNADCIKFLQATNVHLDRLELRAARIGMNLMGCQDVLVEGSEAHLQVPESGGGQAVGFQANDWQTWTGTQRVRFTNCQAHDSQHWGFKIQNAAAVTIDNSVADRNGAGGFLVDQAGVSLTDCSASSNRWGYFVQSADATRLSRCTSQLNANQGIRLAGARGCTLDGCVVEDNGTDQPNTWSGITSEDTWDAPNTGSTQNLIVNCRSGNSGSVGQAWGYATFGANSGFNTIRQCTFQHNQRAPWFLVATDSGADNIVA